ncbi:preprotein translocase subunit SecG [bacterium]|nr:preprotein translocase subunit SecG [bacterium]
MSPIAITMFVLGTIILVIGLLLSGSGTTSGLTTVVGQDLELFKKTKDRGIVKVLQIIMFLLTLTLIACGIMLLVL